MSKYIIDPSNTSISFYVSYLVVAKVKGDILSFNGNISSDINDITDSIIELTVNTDSISTGIEERDDHLRSEDFLDSSNFPTIKFVSKSIEKKRSNYIIKGVIRIKDTSKEIEIVGSYNKEHTSLVMNFTISREDYNLRFNSTLKGNHLVGDEIKIFITMNIPKND